MSEVTVRRGEGTIEVEDEMGEHMATFHGDAGERGFALLLSAIAAQGRCDVFDESRAQYLCGDLSLLDRQN